MNILTTGTKFIQGYLATRRFVSLKGMIKALRREGRYAEERDLIWFGQKRWVESTSRSLGYTFDVIGEENIPSPEDGPFMIYSNHQGYADIAATLWLMKDHGQIGYVAKDDWKKYPILRDVIDSTRSIYLVRDNPKEAVKALSEVKEILDLGFNMCIFPEGTRSKGPVMGEFKAGAFKFAEKAKVPILPVSISGSYKFFEETGNWQKVNIKVTAHPLVHIENMDREHQHQAAKEIEETIRSAL